MRIIAFVGMLFIVIGCAKMPTAPLASYPYVYPIDASPAWSADGQWIAFHRRQASSDGPPGLYMVPAKGGVARFVADGDFFWPEEISIGPDNNRILYILQQQLMMVDVNSKAHWEVIHTDYGVSYADWSSSGRFIAYRRLFYTTLSLPDVDSSGLHVLDVVTGEDRALRATPPGDRLPVYFAIRPVWSRDEEAIVFIHGREDGYDIASVDHNGANYRILNKSPSGTSYDYLRRFDRASHLLEGFLFWQTNGMDAGPKFLSRRSGQLRPFDRFRTIADAVSPDGEWVVTPGIDPRDTAEVLFVERIDDTVGFERRQLTTWRRTPGVPSVAVSGLQLVKSEEGRLGRALGR